MRVALAQMGSLPGDFSTIVRRMLETAERASRLGADLIVFPTTLLGGVYPIGIGESCAFQMATLDAIEDYAAHAPLCSVVPAYVSDGETGYAELFLCQDGDAGPLRLREARQLMDGGRLPEAELATIRVAGAVIQLVVGDSGISSHDADADVVIVFSALPFCDQDSSTLLAAGLGDGALQGLVAECPCTIAMLQGVGGYDDVVLAGGSFAASGEGVVLAACPSFEEGLVTFDVDVATSEADPRAYPAREMPFVSATGDARPADVPCVTGDATLVGMPVAAAPSLEPDARTSLLWRALVVSVRDYVRKSGFSDVIVGLSGGLDSSVVAAIACDALGPEHVLGVLMPGPYSSESSVIDATELAGMLGMQTRTVPISSLFEAASQLYAQALGGEFAGVAAENLQARLRGTTLMSLANATGALVLNTSNKSEAGMGYSTLYGDTVGAFAPLSDVYKSRVYELARWRNSWLGHPVIPQHVLDKPPSAELSPEQTDEASLGMSYDEIDRILTMHVERGMDAGEIAGAGACPRSVDRVLGACHRFEFKRRQEPMGPIVSLRPFADKGWPAVIGWCDHVGASDVPAPGAGEASGAADASDAVPDDFGWEPADELTDMLYEEMAKTFDGQGDPDGDEFDDGVDAPRGIIGLSPVAARLDRMAERLAHRDQVLGVMSDVAYGVAISGRGSDMDDVMGIPLFSKN